MPSSDNKWGIYLPTAGLIIGWLNIAFCVLEFVYVVLLISEMPNVETSEWRPAGHVDEAKLMAYSVLGVYLVFIFVDFITSLLLIVGIDQDNSSLLLPWMILNAMSIAMKLLSNMYILVMWFITATPPLKNMIYFFINLLFTALHCWAWVLVFYLYQYIGDIED